MTEPMLAVYGGVDTHKDTHTAAVVDPVGRVLATATFPATTAGYRDLARWLAGHGQVIKVGVEGTGSYGAGLTEHLRSAKVTVKEVIRPNRATRRRLGKSDTIDAVAAAHAAAADSDDTLPQPKSRDGIVEAIRALRLVLTSTRARATQVANQFQSLVVTAPTPVRQALHDLPTATQLATAAAWRPGDDLADPTTATKTALRMLASEHRQLGTQLTQLRRHLDRLTLTANPALRAVLGVGPDVAAILLITAGDNPQRLRSDAAFAALCGASPIPASSGKTNRHRLNRGGDRQANHALWRIAHTRSQHDPATRAYIERRTNGPGDRLHALRCLKRYIARELLPILTNPQPLPDTTGLRLQRQHLGLTLAAAASHLPYSPSQLSRLERGLLPDRDKINNYHDWLHTQQPAPTNSALLTDLWVISALGGLGGGRRG